MAKAALNKKTLFASKLGLNLRRKPVKCLSRELYGAGTRTPGTVDWKYLGSFEIWCWKRMEIIWIDRMRKKVLHRVKKERNILFAMKTRKTNWLGSFSQEMSSKTLS